MRLRRCVFTFATLVALVTALPSHVSAQFADCYVFCLDTCGSQFYVKGEQQQQWSYYAGHCSYGDCADCPFELVSDTPSVTEITTELLSAADGDLASIVQRHGDRLLIDSNRGMVAITGGCNGDAPVSVAFVPPTLIENLALLGVGSLGEHLEGVFAEP